jgi:hypothetical protein
MIIFTSTDAWVMLSLLFTSTEDGVTLRDLIATADYLNHAIPTYDGLSDSLRQLMKAGHVIKQADRYCAAPAIRSYYAQVTRPRRTINQDWQDVERFLQTTAVTETAPRRAHSRVVTRAAYDKAVRAFCADNLR